MLKRILSVVFVLAAAMVVLAVTTSALGVNRYRRLTTLAEAAEDGIVEARLAMAEGRFADAKSHVRETEGRLASEESLLADYQAELAGLLRNAESQLQCHSFQTLAKEACFEANYALHAHGGEFRSAREQAKVLEEASRRCRKALGIFSCRRKTARDT